MIKIKFLILLGFLSCSNNTYRNRISQFENILGDKKSETLTKAVNEFESKLQDYYQTSDLKIAYKEYFKEMKNANYDFANRFGINRMHEITDTFQLVHLEQEIILRPFDIKYDKGTHVPIYIYYHDNGEVDTIDATKDEVIVRIIRTQSEISTDSVLYRLANRIDYNINGKFFKALDQVKVDDEFINMYLDDTRAAGIVSPQISSSGFLRNNVDIDNYFIKRMVLIAFLY